MLEYHNSEPWPSSKINELRLLECYHSSKWPFQSLKMLKAVCPGSLVVVCPESLGAVCPKSWSSVAVCPESLVPVCPESLVAVCPESLVAVCPGSSWAQFSVCCRVHVYHLPFQVLTDDKENVKAFFRKGQVRYWPALGNSLIRISLPTAPDRHTNHSRTSKRQQRLSKKSWHWSPATRLLRTSSRRLARRWNSWRSRRGSGMPTCLRSLLQSLRRNKKRQRSE